MIQNLKSQKENQANGTTIGLRITKEKRLYIGMRVKRRNGKKKSGKKRIGRMKNGNKRSWRNRRKRFSTQILDRKNVMALHWQTQLTLGHIKQGLS